LELGDEITNEDLYDLLNIMKKEKEGLQAIQDSIMQNARTLSIMEKELNASWEMKRIFVW